MTTTCANAEDGLSATAEKAAPGAPLGELLIEAGSLDVARLDEALELARRWRVPLGAVLVAKGWLTSRELTATLADQADRPFVDLRRMPPEMGLMRQEDLDWYVESRVLPWRRIDGVTVWVSPELAPAEAALQRRWPDRRVVLIGTGRLDLLWALQDQFRDRLTHRAVQALAEQDPECSASRVFTTAQLAALWCIVTLALGSLLVAPTATAIAINCLVIGLFSRQLCVQGRRRHPGRRAAALGRCGERRRAVGARG